MNELNEYLEGGQDEQHKQLREAYGHLGKLRTKKNYELSSGFLEDKEV